MSGTVSSIWRHPIKSHGREALDEVTVKAGCTMPGDRVWAVAHDRSDADGSEWTTCHNFARVSIAPELMAITSRFDEATGTVTLTHPKQGTITVDPEGDVDAFLEWSTPMLADSRLKPARLVRVPGRGMTDSDFPSITLCNMASHRAVEQKIGHELSIHRWRGNIWFDGLPVWEEFDWIDRDIQIGEAILRPRERTDRCNATKANPDTGLRDADTLAALRSWGHLDFSVRAEVVKAGRIAVGDAIRLV